jgi:hypothetical protein
LAYSSTLKVKAMFSSEKSIPHPYELHGVTTYTTILFIVTDMRTSNPTLLR